MVRPWQDGRHFADNIFKRIFLMKSILFWFIFQWILFLMVQLTRRQHWFRDNFVYAPSQWETTLQCNATCSFDVFFDLHLNKRLSKQSWGWWFETLSRPLWCHCNGLGAKQAKRHYLNQWLPRPLTPHGITRPQWVNRMLHNTGI